MIMIAILLGLIVFFMLVNALFVWSAIKVIALHVTALEMAQDMERSNADDKEKVPINPIGYNKFNKE